MDGRVWGEKRDKKRGQRKVEEENKSEREGESEKRKRKRKRIPECGVCGRADGQTSREIKTTQEKKQESAWKVRQGADGEGNREPSTSKRRTRMCVRAIVKKNGQNGQRQVLVRSFLQFYSCFNR